MPTAVVTGGAGFLGSHLCDFLIARDWAVTAGRPLTSDEMARGQRVVLIGATIRRELFPEEDPVGRSVRVGGQAFTVVGVLEPKGPNA